MITHNLILLVVVVVVVEILPKRATGTSGLREKGPPVEATKFEQEKDYFPLVYCVIRYNVYLS